MRRTVSCTAGWYRQHRPETIARSFRFGLLARFDDAPHAGRIDRDRLLDEGVLAFFDGVRQMLRPKMGRLGQQHDVDVAVDHLLVGVEAGEHMARLDLHLVLALRKSAELVEAGLGEIGERIANGHEHIIRTGMQRILRGTGAAPTATDEANFDRFTHAGMHGPRHGERTGQCSAHCQTGRRFEKVTPRRVRVFVPHDKSSFENQ